MTVVPTDGVTPGPVPGNVFIGLSLGASLDGVWCDRCQTSRGTEVVVRLHTVGARADVGSTTLLLCYDCDAVPDGYGVAH